MIRLERRDILPGRKRKRISIRENTSWDEFYMRRPRKIFGLGLGDGYIEIGLNMT